MSNQIDRLATINAAIQAPDDSVTGSIVAFFHYQELDMRSSITRELAKMTANASDFGSAVSISSTMTNWIASMSATAMLSWSIVDALAVRGVPLATVQTNLVKAVLALSRVDKRTTSQDLELTSKSEALYYIDQTMQHAEYNRRTA